LDKIYLDLCCLKRSFDDQRQERVRREAAAVTAIVEQAERGGWALVRSPALLVENDANPREDRRLATALWIDGAAIDVAHSDAVATRARELHGLGFGVLDGLHIAYAEAAGARWLVTCDDRLTDLARRQAARLRIGVVNPCDLGTEHRP
jgi:predicted nucleic acid-binding protein